ncbi:MAG TPA: nucleotidyltransferase family protein [Pirellulaceae bacterium]
MTTAKYTFDANKVIEICRQNGVSKLGLFGSMARGEDTAASDVDLLVEFATRTSLLELVALERKISAAIGRKVDLLTEAALSPYLRDRILREVKVLYEA